MNELLTPERAQQVAVPQLGTLRYWDIGEGPTLVFVHGLLVNAQLWRKVVAPLSEHARCIVVDWPLGSHREAMLPDADLGTAGLASGIARFLEVLDLEDVVLVANDTGGALSQVVATEHPARLAGLVLTNCDAFEVFPPRLFQYLLWMARVPGGVAALVQTLRLRPLRRLPIAFGALSKTRVPDAVLDQWARPSAESAGVRRDLQKTLRALSPRDTLRAAERAPNFEAPVLLAWGREDPLFPPSLAERLAGVFPKARIEWCDGSRCFVPEDRPEWLAERIRAFLPG